MDRPLPSLLIKAASASCNLACRYCFYRDRADDPYKGVTGRKVMSDEVLTELVRQFLAMPNRVSNFCWQGGEPLMAGYEFYERAFELEASLGSPGQRVANAVQTNGVLIDERIAKLFAKYHVFVGLSLDGPASLHDLQRVDSRGNGSHEKVMAATRILGAHEVMYNILSVVTPACVGRVREIYEFMLANGFNYLQFIPNIEIDRDTGKLTPNSITRRAYGRFLCELFDVWYADGRPAASIRFFDNCMEALAGHVPQSCAMQQSCADYVVVEYTGDVFPCDFIVRPDWLLGNIMERPLPEILRGERWREFLAIKPNLPRPCLKCEFQSICRGGCPYDRLMSGDFRRPPLLCAGYKMFFEHAVPRLRKVLKRLCPDNQAKRRGPP